MSLFPIEHLSISLTPTAIGIAVYRGRWRPSRVELLEVPIERPETGAIPEVLASSLKNMAKPGTTVRFTISNRLCRVAVLPWFGDQLNASERQIFIQSRFSDLYGEMNAWEIRDDSASVYGQTSLAVAMPQQFLIALREVVRMQKLRCLSITAHAVDSWNRNGDRMRGEGLFAVIEPEMAFLMTLRASESSEISSARLLAYTPESAVTGVKPLIERELLLQGIAGDAAVLCDTLGALPGGDSFRYFVLPYSADISSPAMAMAVNGMDA